VMEQRAIKVRDCFWMCEPQIASSWRSKRKSGAPFLHPAGTSRSTQ